jgi:hypothetical protein
MRKKQDYETFAKGHREATKALMATNILFDFVEDQDKMCEEILEKVHSIVEPEKYRKRGYLDRLINEKIDEAFQEIDKKLREGLSKEQVEEPKEFKEAYLLWALKEIPKRLRYKGSKKYYFSRKYNTTKDGYSLAHAKNGMDFDHIIIAEKAFNYTLGKIKKGTDERSIDKIMDHALNIKVKGEFLKHTKAKRQEYIPKKDARKEETNKDDPSKEGNIEAYEYERFPQPTPEYVALIDPILEWIDELMSFPEDLLPDNPTKNPRYNPVLLQLINEVLRAIIWYTVKGLNSGQHKITALQATTLLLVLDGYTITEISEILPEKTYETVIDTVKETLNNIMRCLGGMHTV